MFLTRKKIVFIIILNLFFTVFAVSQNKALTAPNFTIISTNNDTFNLYTELGKGNAVLLDFFSLYCAPCQVNTSKLDTIYRRYGSGDSLLLVFGIESEFGTNTQIDSFKTMFGASFPCFSSKYLDNDTILSLYNITYTPVYYLVCTDTTTKPLSFSQLQEALNICVGEPYISYNISDNIIADFKIYPNPASTYLQIESKKLKIKNSTIYDVTGRNLIGTNSSKLSKSNKIDISNLPKGIYFIKLQTEKGIVVKKFVKH